MVKASSGYRIELKKIVFVVYYVEIYKCYENKEKRIEVTTNLASNVKLG